MYFSSISSAGSSYSSSFPSKIETPDRDVKQSDKLPLPPGLRKTLPVPETPWKISDELFKRLQFPSSPTKEKYRKIELTQSDTETAFVYLLFNHSRPKNRSIRKVHCMHNPGLTRAFETNLPLLEEQANNPAFAPKLESETDVPLRKRTLERWGSAAHPFSPLQLEITSRKTQELTKTFVLPLWHGTSQPICESIASAGFTYFGKQAFKQDKGGDGVSTDIGFFGSGIYFTNSARYCSQSYGKEHMLLTWVAMRQPFPVVADHASISLEDEPKDKAMLKGMGAYKNYNAHYIPVTKVSSLGKPTVHYPCAEGQKPKYDEIVVFHNTHTLPRFWVELAVDLPISPSSSSSSSPSQTLGSLLDKLYEMIENPSIQQEKEICSLLENNAETLIEKDPSAPLSSEYFTLYNSISRLLDTSGKVRRVVAQHLLKKSGSIATSLHKGVDISISSSSSFTSSSSSHSVSFSTSSSASSSASSFSSLSSSTHPTLGSLRDKLDAMLKSQHLEKAYPKLNLQLSNYAKKIRDKSSDALLWEEEMKLYILISRLLYSGGVNSDVANSLFKEKSLYPVPSTNHHPHVLKGHTGEVWCLAQLADGRLASGSGYGDDTIRLWPLDGSPPTILKEPKSSVYCLAQLADGRLTSGSASDGTIRIWPLDGSTPTILTGHTKHVWCLAQLADERIASGSYDHTIRIWPLDGSSPTVLTGHTGSVFCLTQLADGRIASGSYDDTIRIWPIDGSTPTVLKGHTYGVNCIAQLADGRIASGSHDRTIWIWPLDGSTPTVLKGHTSLITCLAQLADGRLASGSDDRTIRIWPLDGSPPAVLKGHTWSVNCLTQLADGRLASGSKDSTIRIWERSDLLQGKDSIDLIT